MTTRIRRLITRSVLALVVAVGGPAAVIGGYCGWLQYEGNIHVVRQDSFYRSAQLRGTELARVINDHGIKAILNLRGGSPGATWYEDELAQSRALGIAHYDYGISDRRRVGRDEIEKILEIIRAAPKPILVHCKAGADRTGLISAAYLLMVDGDSAETAKKQLSLFYGHFPFLGSRTKAMDESFAELAREIAPQGGSLPNREGR